LFEVADPAEKFNQSDRRSSSAKELVLHVLGIGEDVGKRAEFFTVVRSQQIHRKKNKPALARGILSIDISSSGDSSITPEERREDEQHLPSVMNKESGLDLMALTSMCFMGRELF